MIFRKSIDRLWIEINRLNKHAEILQAEKDLAEEKVKNLIKIIESSDNFLMYPILSQIKMEQLLSQFKSDYFRDFRIHPFVKEGFELIMNEKVVLKNKFDLDPLLESENLNNIFKKYGSDKGERHNYGSIYQNLVGENRNPLILEIGIGSENNFMYASGFSAGSLKAWREFYPSGTVIGADIDIQSVKNVDPPAHVVDQTSEESLENLVDYLKQFNKLDLVIEDGFHDFHANIRTFIHIFPLLKSGGNYVIEDVHESMIEIWTVVGGYLGLDLRVLDLRQYRPGVTDNILVVIKKG